MSCKKIFAGHLLRSTEFIPGPCTARAGRVSSPTSCDCRGKAQIGVVRGLQPTIPGKLDSMVRSSWLWCHPPIKREDAKSYPTIRRCCRAGTCCCRIRHGHGMAPLSRSALGDEDASEPASSGTTAQSSCDGSRMASTRSASAFRGRHAF